MKKQIEEEARCLFFFFFNFESKYCCGTHLNVEDWDTWVKGKHWDKCLYDNRDFFSWFLLKMVSIWGPATFPTMMRFHLIEWLFEKVIFFICT